MLFGGIEAGGTKCVAVVGTGPVDIRAEVRVPTTSPVETLGALAQFLTAQIAVHGPLDAIGIGSFGPVDLRAGSARWGWITSTPKPGWADVDVAGPFERAFGVPVGFDTDVNAAALGEWRHGAAQGLDTFVYLTVGTGIGGGGLAGGRPLHGLVHPEMGHVRVPHDRDVDPFAGVCPYHGDCLEGLACGPAIEARWGRPASALPSGHAAWALEAHYLALALHGIVCTLSPQRAILGGGVMSEPSLLPLIRADLSRGLNGYIQSPAVLRDMDTYVVPPALGGRAGVVGALELAREACERRGSGPEA